MSPQQAWMIAAMISVQQKKSQHANKSSQRELTPMMSASQR